MSFYIRCCLLYGFVFVVFFFKQKTAYEMRISDWSSDVCSSDLKRYIGNSVQVFFKDGSSTDLVSIDYPIGHRRRRAEGIPVLMAKCQAALRGDRKSVV